ncbi:MAG: glycosyltransferase [Flavobacteriaceae bacterium]
MKIGMVLDGSYPSDIRVRKEAESLAAFHDVFVLCTGGENEKGDEVVNGVRILRSVKKRSTVVRGITDVVASINFIHPFFKRALPKFVKDHKIEALHVHDLPLAKTVLLAAKKYKIVSVLDLHENYPAALTTWFSWRTNNFVRLKNKLFFSYHRWRSYESKMLKRYDVLITVVDEMKERIVNQHSIPKDKIIVVPNSEKKSFAENFKDTLPNYFKEYQDKFIISYVGGFGPHRGLHTAIEGMEYVSKEIPNALLVLIGPSNRDVRSHLNAIIKENSLEEFVLIKGSEPFHNVVNIMKSSHLNIIPHISNEHTESAVPHKFFQILLSKKPLLVSDCRPMKRIIEEREIGNYFTSEDPLSFSKKVLEIKEKYEESLQKANKGYEHAYEGNLNWEVTSQALIELYEKL